MKLGSASKWIKVPQKAGDETDQIEWNCSESEENIPEEERGEQASEGESNQKHTKTVVINRFEIKAYPDSDYPPKTILFRQV